MSSNLTQISKFLSYVLRHQPESINLQVDKHGWAHIPELIQKANKDGRNLSSKQIQAVCNRPGKKRFMLSEDNCYIRAGYGHSIDVDLELEPKKPPEILFHGTAKRNVDSIRTNGLQPQNRQMVHLSLEREDAISVGRRHGTPIILEVAAVRMHTAGFPLYESGSEQGIWLTDVVAPEFINIK